MLASGRRDVLEALEYSDGLYVPFPAISDHAVSVFNHPLAVCFKNFFFFLEQFRLTAKLRGRYRNSPYTTYLLHY